MAHADLEPCQPGDRQSKLAIIFAMYNAPDRQAMTQDVLRFYASELNFPLKDMYIVDSSNTGVAGLGIPQENQVVFDQNEVCNNFSSSTDLENCSINYARKHLSLYEYDYVFKLTTKYKLPDLLNHIPPPDTTELIVQDAHSPGWQNTELFGFRASKWDHLHASLMDMGGLQEQKMDALAREVPTCRMPSMENVAPYKRGAGDHLRHV